MVPVPRSGDPTRQRENLDVFDFELDAADHALIAGLDRGIRVFGIEPLTHEEF